MRLAGVVDVAVLGHLRILNAAIGTGRAITLDWCWRVAAHLLVAARSASTPTLLLGKLLLVGTQLLPRRRSELLARRTSKLLAWRPCVVVASRGS